MADESYKGKERRRQPRPEKVRLVSIHSVNAQYKSLVAICDDLSNIQGDRTRGRPHNQKLLATSELGWRTQIRKLLVEPFRMDEALRFHDGKKLGSFMGKISGIYEIPFRLYDYHRKAVFHDTMTKEYKEASEGISNTLAKESNMTQYTIPLVGGLEIRAQAPKEIEGSGDVAGSMTTVIGDKAQQTTIASLFLRCLGVGGGVKAINDILSLVKEQADIARNNVVGANAGGALAAHSALQTVLRNFYTKIDAEYGERIKEFSPVRISYT